MKTVKKALVLTALLWAAHHEHHWIETEEQHAGSKKIAVVAITRN